ncbi:helix-turn-helix transcriptional regulator [Bacillus sp. FJAT-28004]|uniref:helix-turn-helix transcriptional regulator n=1 Tax=Bacillus sp. FJAT-28004 TaxID=1679165 RepID=UPI0006B68607|nr:helix-turn-helix transcriptional regulator [Bacillus sp. FJAT-28004]
MKIKRIELIKARKNKGYTQSDLSEMVGISRAYLANIERGEHDPSLKVAQSISKHLGIGTDSIFFEKDVRNMNIVITDKGA